MWKNYEEITNNDNFIFIKFLICFFACKCSNLFRSLKYWCRSHCNYRLIDMSDTNSAGLPSMTLTATLCFDIWPLMQRMMVQTPARTSKFFKIYMRTYFCRWILLSKFVVTAVRFSLKKVTTNVPHRSSTEDHEHAVDNKQYAYEVNEIWSDTAE